MAVLQGAHEAFLIALQLPEAHTRVERAVKDRGELDTLGLPLRAGHHPGGGVAVAVAPRAVQPTGAQRVAGDEPQRELVASTHDPAALVDDPRPVGRRQDPERRLGQQLTLSVDLDVPQRVEHGLITRCGLQVQAGEHARRELREMRMAGRERVASLVLDASCQAARILRRATQPRLADLTDRARHGVLSVLERVDEDPRECLAELRVIVARACGLLALLGDGEAGVTFGVLDRGGVQVDELVAALDERLRAERQQHRQAPRRGKPGELPRGPPPAVAGEHPHPTGWQHRQVDRVRAEFLEVGELLQLLQDVPRRRVRRGGTQPLDPRRAVRAPLKQPVQAGACGAVGELVCERVERRLMRAFACRADQPDELVDRRPGDPLDVQLLGRQREERLRTLVLHRAGGQPGLERGGLRRVPRPEAGVCTCRGELVGTRLTACAVGVEVRGVRLELVAQLKQRRLRDLGQVVGDEPQPAQRAQLHRHAEAAVAAVLEREAQVGGQELEVLVEVLRADLLGERVERAALRETRPAGH